ncbi:threonine-phosphate decarboxylase CobD [Pelosinus sp. sgz500959]|uniref:threonine-phosphate decarboxylase CobD n=1 Tax=Pelosinus sp. sgz500959 TaxID=3242472 RepID=UPI003673497E
MSGNNAPKHGGNLYAAMRQKGGSLNEILDFSANINPLGLSEQIRQTLYASLESIIHYPDVQGHALKQELSHYYHVKQEQITLGNGAVELMYVLCHMLKPKRVLVTAPTFSEYESAARASGAAIEYFYLNAADDFTIDIQGIAQQLPAIDIVFICNPNNPTGKLLSNGQIEELVAMAKVHQTYVVVDESFLDFLLDDHTYTCRSLLEKYNNLIILHSLTKFYAIPGLRLGFSLTNPELTNRLHAGKDPWNVNTLAQNAGVAALRDEEYQHKSKEFIKKVNMDLYHSLLTIPGLKPYKPSVNFILINIKDTNLIAEELRQALAAHNILIRDCSNYPGLSPDYIRIAVKSPEQNHKLIAALQQIIGGIE